MTAPIKNKYSNYLLFILLISLHSSALAQFIKNTAPYRVTDIIMLIFKCISIVGGTAGVLLVARTLFVSGKEPQECYGLIATTILVGSFYGIAQFLFFIGKMIVSSMAA
jgi:hypothetical protein